MKGVILSASIGEKLRLQTLDVLDYLTAVIICIPIRTEYKYGY